MDADGNVVCCKNCCDTYLKTNCSSRLLCNSHIILYRYPIYIALEMPMASSCLPMLPVHKEFQVLAIFQSSFLKQAYWCTCLILNSYSNVVVEQISGRDHILNHLSIPAACFTHPEISMVGLTEVSQVLFIFLFQLLILPMSCIPIQSMYTNFNS